MSERETVEALDTEVDHKQGELQALESSLRDRATRLDMLDRQMDTQLSSKRRDFQVGERIGGIETHHEGGQVKEHVQIGICFAMYRYMGWGWGICTNMKL